VLENTRFHPEEEKNDPKLAAQMAKLADIFVNDAFGSAHRAHSSTEGVARLLPAVAGFLMEKEIQYLGQAIADPKRPFIAILGGAKISDKIGVIKNLLAKADLILIGGGMANTFLKAQGLDMAGSLVEDEALETARELLKVGAAKLRLPVDVVIAESGDEGVPTKVIPAGNVPAGWKILILDQKPSRHSARSLRTPVQLFWNGPMGMFEVKPFDKGTFGIGKALAESHAVSIVGGGDSASAIQKPDWQTKLHMSPQAAALRLKC